MTFPQSVLEAQAHSLLRLIWTTGLPNPPSDPIFSFLSHLIPDRDTLCCSIHVAGYGTVGVFPCPPRAGQGSDQAPLDSRSLTRANTAVSQHPQPPLLWYTQLSCCGFPCASYPENQDSQGNPDALSCCQRLRCYDTSSSGSMPS